MVYEEAEYFYKRFHNLLMFHLTPLVKNLSVHTFPRTIQTPLLVNGAVMTLSRCIFIKIEFSKNLVLTKLSCMLLFSYHTYLLELLGLDHLYTSVYISHKIKIYFKFSMSVFSDIYRSKYFSYFYFDHIYLCDVYIAT